MVLWWFWMSSSLALSCWTPLRRRMAVALPGWTAPKAMFFFGGHNELGGYMVTGLLITPHNWDELGYTCLLNVTNHLANLATSKVKDQPVSALGQICWALQLVLRDEIPWNRLGLAREMEYDGTLTGTSPQGSVHARCIRQRWIGVLFFFSRGDMIGEYMFWSDISAKSRVYSCFAYVYNMMIYAQNINCNFLWHDDIHVYTYYITLH